MTTGDLKDVIAAYFERTATDLTVSGVDLGLRALNNARKTLERQRDWFNQQVVGTLLVDPDNGAMLGNATLFLDDEIGIDVKSVETFYLVAEAENPVGLIPIYHHGKQTVSVKAKKRVRNSRMVLDGETRYPSDDVRVNFPLPSNVGNQVFLHGGKVFLYPRPEAVTQVAFDCQVWMEDYDSDNDSDWMIEAAPDYFQWAAIIELNHLWGQFVQTQDGNLPPPEKMKAEALASLIEWDTQLFEAGRQPRATNA